MNKSMLFGRSLPLNFEQMRLIRGRATDRADSTVRIVLARRPAKSNVRAVEIESGVAS